MSAIPFYMDLQASFYHRNLARSTSIGESRGIDSNGQPPALAVHPRSNVYSRSISLRNGYTNGHVVANGSIAGSAASKSQTPVQAVAKDGRRVIFAQRSPNTGPDNGLLLDASLLFKEAGLFLGSAMQNFILEDEDAVYSQFTKCHKCYDVKKAFFALVENGVRAAPLWDSAKGQFVGMLTITDFIHILRRYYRSGVVGIKELEEHKIATWRDVLAKDHMLKPFITMDAKESLYNAVQALCDGKVHRLPIMDKTSGNILYILTHQKILRFLYVYIRDLPAPSFLQRTPKELGIGACDGIVTVKENTKLIDALSHFLDKRVSALPVVDESGKIVDTYAKADVFDLAADKSYNNLSITVEEALKHRSDPSGGPRLCNEKDSLSTVIKLMFEEKVHRVIIADDDLRVRGMVSLSDIMAYLVLRPQAENNDSVE